MSDAEFDQQLLEIKASFEQAARFRMSLIAESDRGSGLMCAQYLDDRLGELLKRSMLSDKVTSEDAAYVGAVSRLEAWNMQTLRIKATGRGSYQRTRLDSHGFTRGYLTRSKTVHGFRTVIWSERLYRAERKPVRTREESQSERRII